MDNNKTYYIIVPADIFFNDDINNAQIRLYGLINNYSNMYYGYAFASNETMAKELGVSPRTISRNLNELKKQGTIKIINLIKDGVEQRRIFPVDKFANFDYMLNNLADDEKLVSVETSAPIYIGGRQKCRGGVDKNVYGGVDKNVYHNNNTMNNNTIYPKKYIKKGRAFVKPTLEQVKDYINEKQLNVDADYYFDYNEAKGWLVGKAPMKDWKASLRNWHRNSKKFNQNNNNKNTQADIDFFQKYEV